MKWSKRSEITMGIVLLAVLALAGSLWRLLDQQGLESPACPPGAVGVWGPLKLEFNETMQQQTVKTRASISPNLNGTWLWQGNDLLFYPHSPLLPTNSSSGGYSIRLMSGAQNLKGQTIQNDFSCLESVRDPEIIFQSVGQQLGDLVEVSLDGSGQKVITQFSSPVLSFSPSPDGEALAVSAQNQDKGSDLWLVDREKGGKSLLVDCTTNNCNNPVWSPDGQEIAYDRSQLDPSGTRQRQPSQVWRIRLSSRENEPLIAGKDNTGQFPQYSPDGQKLAYFDQGNGGINIVRLDGTDHTLVKSNSTYFTWSPDSSALFYFSDVVEMESHYMNTYIYHFSTQQSEILLNEYKGQFEFGHPIWTPDGNWITMAVRLSMGSAGLSKQLVMMRVDGSEVKNITNDQLFTQTSYHWSPDGTWLVYQRLELGSSNVKPQILVWNRSTGESKLVVEGGGMPDWLP